MQAGYGARGGDRRGGPAGDVRPGACAREAVGDGAAPEDRRAHV